MSNSEIIQIVAPLLIIELALKLFVLYRLTKDKVKYIPKWAWALIIIFISTVGPLAYLILGRERD